MTRKRFNKLLMAKGYDRNRIAALAKKLPDFETYDRLYKAITYSAFPGGINGVIEAMGRAVTAAFRAYGEAAKTVGEGLIRLADSLAKERTRNENN